MNVDRPRRRLTAFISYADSYTNSVWAETLAQKILTRARIHPDYYYDDPVIGGPLTDGLKRRIEAAQILIFVVDEKFIERPATRREWAAALNRLRASKGAPAAESRIIRNDSLPLIYLFAVDDAGREWLELAEETRDIAYADFERYQFVTDKVMGVYPRNVQAFAQFLRDIEERLETLRHSPAGEVLPVIEKNSQSLHLVSTDAPTGKLSALVVLGRPDAPLEDRESIQARIEFCSELIADGESVFALQDRWVKPESRKGVIALLNSLQDREALYLQICDRALVDDNMVANSDSTDRFTPSDFEILRSQLRMVSPHPKGTTSDIARLPQPSLILWLPPEVQDRGAFTERVRPLPSQREQLIFTNEAAGVLADWLRLQMGLRRVDVAVRLEDTFHRGKDEILSTLVPRLQAFGDVDLKYWRRAQDLSHQIAGKAGRVIIGINDIRLSHDRPLEPQLRDHIYQCEEVIRSSWPRNRPGEDVCRVLMLTSPRLKEVFGQTPPTAAEGVRWQPLRLEVNADAIVPYPADIEAIARLAAYH